MFYSQVLFACLLALLSLVPAASVRVQDDAYLVKNVQAFIDRLLVRGGVSSNLAFTPRLEIIAAGKDELTGESIDLFEIDGKDGQVVIRGSSGPALTAGVGAYFRNYLKCDVYWENGGGYSFGAFPSKIEDILIPATAERHVFMSQKRYYQNTCTASYTFVWRSEESYLQEIDWMGFNGINLPLAFTGQEFVWYQLYHGVYGVSQEGMDKFFSGPAFLAWNRMSNLRAWAGPLPQSWIVQQFALQKKLLARYQELGIEPVLPAFNGVVPGEMQALFPTANITQLNTPWCSFPTDYCCPFVVSSTDPLFEQIGAKFLTLQRELYGSVVEDVHTYNTDTFNENKPNSADPTYLASSSAAVFSSMRKGDPQATWLMQAWLFVENRGEEDNFWTDEAIAAYLSGVPDEGMLLLDLTSDEVPMWPTLAANKKKFIWCLLHNYGGARALYGNLTMLATSPIESKRAVPHLFHGTGLTMEAIDQNPIVYEFMNEVSRYGAEMDANAMANVDVDVNANTGTSLRLQRTSEWVRKYAERRYSLAATGVTEDQRNAAQAAWDILLPLAYSGYVGCYHPTCPRRSIITTRPLLNLYQETAQPAGPLVQAWARLQQVAQKDLGAYRYDLVDVGRQVMSNLFYDFYRLWQAALARGDSQSFRSLGESMVRLREDWDELLLTHEAFLFGRWVNDAKNWATGPAEAELYEFNARNQLTLWGPKAVGLKHLYGYIQDYAAKNWGGLVLSYYAKRWRLFMGFANKALVSGQGPAALATNATLLNAYIDAEVLLGEEFCRDTDTSFSSSTLGDTWETSNRMQARYGAQYDSSAAGLSYEVRPDEEIMDPAFDINSLQSGLGPAWTDDAAQLRMLCDAMPACAAFSSAGYFKLAQGLDTVTHSPGSTLYIKRAISGGRVSE